MPPFELLRARVTRDIRAQLADNEYRKIMEIEAKEQEAALLARAAGVAAAKEEAKALQRKADAVAQGREIAEANRRFAVRDEVRVAVLDGGEELLEEVARLVLGEEEAQLLRLAPLVGDVRGQRPAGRVLHDEAEVRRREERLEGLDHVRMAVAELRLDLRVWRWVGGWRVRRARR